MVTDFRQLQKDIHEWACDTFEKQTVAAKLEHLKREIVELIENPSDRLEMADVQILLMGVASLQGVDLMDATLEKFEIVKKRKWGAPDEFGVVHHVK